jgi:hypothetical protein
MIQLSKLSHNETKQDDTEEFWIPPLDHCSDDSYCRIVFPLTKPRISIWDKNPDMILEYVFLACLLIVGACVLFVRVSQETDTKAVLGSIFFDSSFIPLVKIVLQIVKKGKKVSVENVYNITNFTLLGFLSLGVGLLWIPSGGWSPLFGGALFEAGLVFWLYRALFFVPNPEDEVKLLEERIKELENSAAIGLADGYFYNFIKLVATELKVFHQEEKSVKIQIKSNQSIDQKPEVKEYNHIPKITIFLPKMMTVDSNLINENFNEVIEFSKELTAIGNAKEAIVPPRNNSYRQLWVKCFFVPDRLSQESSEPWNGLFDVPPPLNVLAQNVTFRNKDLKSLEVKKNEIERELNIFKARLAWHLQVSGFDKVVDMIEIPSFNIKQMNQIVSIMTQVFI